MRETSYGDEETVIPQPTSSTPSSIEPREKTCADEARIVIDILRELR
jgi:hypothetical protein